MVVSGGGDDLDGMAVGVDDSDCPAGEFADVVAAFAHPSPVLGGGGTAVGMPVDMVEMPDRRPTERIPAHSVAAADQVGEPTAEPTLALVGIDDQLAAVAGGAGEQPAPPTPGLSI